MKNINTMAALAVAALMTFTGLAVAEEVWHLDTDTGLSIPMNEVSCLLAADDDTHFLVLTTANKVYDGVTNASFAKREHSGVQHIEAHRIAVFPSVVNSSITVAGCKNGASVTVTSLAGQKCLSATAADRQTTIDVSNLQPGCYLLTVGSQTVKFVKR